MTLPGSTVSIVDAPPPISALNDTGTAFVIGLAASGPITGVLTASDAIHSLGEWEDVYGTRQSYNGPEYDAIESFFAEGGARLFFARYTSTTPTDADRQAALDRFARDLGPGDVFAPGDTRAAMHAMLATHARDYNRFAYCDAPDSATAATVAAAGTALRALDVQIARHAQVLAPWVTIPGLTSGTTRTAPPSGIQAGMAARNDQGGNPNRAVAGRNGISRYAIDVENAWTDTDRETLADAGVTVIRNIRGLIQTYDDITPVDPDTQPEWLGAAGNRLVMRIVADALEIADSHMFGEVSGPVDLAAFAGDLKGMLAGWFAAGALFSLDGTTDGAFRVEAGTAVNTPTTLAARQLKAALSLKISPNARQVIINITNTPLQSAL